eukprot:6484317-Amphidinium_carterae.1
MDGADEICDGAANLKCLSQKPPENTCFVSDWNLFETARGLWVRVPCVVGPLRPSGRKTL